MAYVSIEADEVRTKWSDINSTVQLIMDILPIANGRGTWTPPLPVYTIHSNWPECTFWGLIIVIAFLGTDARSTDTSGPRNDSSARELWAKYDYDVGQ